MNAFRRGLLAHWTKSADAWEAARPAIRRASGLRTWNPQLYGLPVYERFAAHYTPQGPGALLAFGLNPGKYGMAQTGLPFTDVHSARTALPALGFDRDPPGLAPSSLRPFLLPVKRERSCQSVYGFFERAYGSAEAGWRDFYVSVPCGLLFLTEEGENVTPADARLARLPRVNGIRREVVADAIRVAKPRAVLFLGQDVARACRDVVLEAMAPEAVIEMDHPVARGPGRRGPAWWAEALHARLGEARLLPDARRH